MSHATFGKFAPVFERCGNRIIFWCPTMLFSTTEEASAFADAVAPGLERAIDLRHQGEIYQVSADQVIVEQVLHIGDQAIPALALSGPLHEAILSRDELVTSG